MAGNSCGRAAASGTKYGVWVRGLLSTKYPVRLAGWFLVFLQCWLAAWLLGGKVDGGEMTDVVLLGGEVVGLDDSAVLEIGSLFFSPLLRFDLCGNLRNVFYPAFHILGITRDLPQVAQNGRVVGKVAQLGLLSCR